jgi:hypothetical protein
MKQFLLFIPALVIVFASLNPGISSGATRAVDTPLTHTKSLNKSTTNPNAKPRVFQKRAGDKVQAAYFSNWYVTYCPEGLRSDIDQLKGHLRR